MQQRATIAALQTTVDARTNEVENARIKCDQLEGQVESMKAEIHIRSGETGSVEEHLRVRHAWLLWLLIKQPITIKCMRKY